MKKQLSSLLTFVFKVIVPLVNGVALVVAVAVTVTNEPLVGIALLLGLAIMMLITYHTILKLKVVKVDSDNLYVSNYLRKTVVPLENVRAVKENILFSPRMVRIHFYEETTFGYSITFIASTIPFLFFSSHPVINEILHLKDARLRKQRHGEVSI